MSDDVDIPVWIAANGAGVARVLGEGAGGLSIRPIVRVGGRSVLRVEAGGAVGVVKAFDAADPAMQKPFERELAMLAALQGSGLSPKLLGYSRKGRYVVMDFVQGETVQRKLSADTAEVLAGRMGSWFREYAARVQRVPAQTDWLAYLSNYAEFDMGVDLAGHAEWLRDMPIPEMAIAKNDGFSANFILAGSGVLVGIDFEAASLKPLGWDILLTARMFYRDVPDAARAATEALVAGWLPEEDSAGRQALTDLAVFFAEATKHIGPDG